MIEVPPMSIIESWEYMPLTMEEDPDDYRPQSELAIIIDPSDSADNYVQGLTVFKEKIAPGTEGDDPQPPIAFDVRELVEGNPEEAVHQLSVKDFE